MKNTCPFYIIFQVLKVLLKKICKKSHQIFYLLFLLTFTSADIIFHKFLGLHSTLSEKKDFRHELSSLMDSLKLPTPLTAKIC